MAGIRITHIAARNVVYLVPITKKPFFGQSLDICPTCNVMHLCKTVHLWLDGDGSCIVSQGVLEDLKSAGMPDLLVSAEVVSPPPLAFFGKLFINKPRMHGDHPRQQIDYENRKLVRWSPIHK